MSRVRFDLGVYVAPEHVEAVRALLLEKGDGCLLLDIERLIGARLDGPLTMPFVRTSAPYGTNVATVSLDDIDE